jgi:hypothetical protein
VNPESQILKYPKNMSAVMIILLASCQQLHPRVGEPSFDYASRAENAGLLTLMEAYEVRRDHLMENSRYWDGSKWISRQDEATSLGFMPFATVA